MNLIKPSKQKKALLKNGSNIIQIADMYYEQKIFNDQVKDRNYQKQYYVHLVDEIMKKFGISSTSELLFLLHRGVGEQIGECQFCGLIKTKVKVRSSLDGYNYVDCYHAAICNLCKKPCRNTYKRDLCFECFDHEAENFHRRNDPEKIRFRFLQAVGNHDYIIRMKENKDIEELKRMKSMAEEYAVWFDELIMEVENS